jgi:hypothetical protein
MRVSVRAFALAACLALEANPALAGTYGVYLPPPPSGPGGEDSIETASGTRCRQSINSSGPYLDVGASGTAASPIDDPSRVYSLDQRDRTAMAYVRLTVPIGRRPVRIDCSEVYRLEIERLRREIELMRMNAE